MPTPSDIPAGAFWVEVHDFERGPANSVIRAQAGITTVVYLVSTDTTPAERVPVALVVPVAEYHDLATLAREARP